MSDGSYPYMKLRIERCEIRLLTLTPGGRDEPIQCRLSVASLTDSPSYTALSYVWSSEVALSGTKPEVFLDGHQIPVTPNLYAALRHLRPPAGQEPIIVWIDAITINQRDVDERNQQVAMMRDIYASAAEVIIWLGIGDEDSSAAFDAFPVVADQVSWFWCDDKDRSTLQHQRILEHCGDFFMSLQSQYPWFTRVWILQELALATKDPTVVCGWKRTTWSILVAVWQAIAKDPSLGFVQLQKEWTSPTGESHFLSLTKLDILNTLRQSTQANAGESLQRLLVMSRTSVATDPRDRIYGLLGLLDKQSLDSVPLQITVDYRKSCAEVYTDAVKHIFSRGDGPYFLSGVFLSGGLFAAPQVPSHLALVDNARLPSWVPDFTRQTAETARQPSGLAFLPPATMTASGAGQGAKNGKVLDDGCTLQIEGLFVDIVDEIVPFGSSLETMVESLTCLDLMTAAARKKPCVFKPSVAPYMRKFRTSEPLWRVLISNKNIKSGYEPAPGSYEDTFLDYLASGSIRDKLLQEPDDALKPGFELALRAGIGKKKFFTTENGFIGTGTPNCRKGDVIAIVFGSPSPFMLRPMMGEESVYLLIGTCYMGGIMGGEMVDELYCEDLMVSTTFFIR